MKHSLRYYHPLAAVGIFLCLALSLRAADSIVIGTDAPIEGTFQTFKNDRIYFQTADGKKLIEQSKEVTSLILDPPANATVKPKGKKNIEGMKLKGYEAPNFLFGADGNENMPASKISTITLALDFARKMKSPEKEVVKDADQPINVDDLVETNGVVTIIHFHMEDVASAIRIVNYVNQLGLKSHGKIVVKKVELKSWDSPTAKEYDITSAPQFWVYNRKGELVKKIVDYHSPEEIDKVVKEARR